MERPFRVDWNHIKEVMAAIAAEDRYLVVLPHAGRHLLMSMIERLTWAATYRIPGYDYNDFDQLQAIVADTEYGLQRGTRMDDLIEAIDRIKEAIDALEPVISQSNTITTDCCHDYIQTDSDVVVGEGDVPQAIQDSQGIDHDDWEGYESYLCRAALTWHDALVEILLSYKNLVSAGLVTISAILAVTALLAPLGIAIIASFGAVAALYGALFRTVDAAFLDEFIAEVIDNRNEFVCLVTKSSTAEQAWEKYKIYVNGYTEPKRTILLNATSLNTFNALYNGEHDGKPVQLRYETGVCDCQETEPEYELDKTYHFDTEDDPEGWTFTLNSFLGDGFIGLTAGVNHASASIQRGNYLAAFGLPSNTKYKILHISFKATNTHTTGACTVHAVLRAPSSVACGANANIAGPIIEIPANSTIEYLWEPTYPCRGTDTVNSNVSVRADRVGNGPRIVHIDDVRVAGETCDCS